MANWDKVRQKNSVGPALGMAMNKAIDIAISHIGDHPETAIETLKESILNWRDWIYEENEKKQRGVLDALLKEAETPKEATKELLPEKDLI